MGEECSPHEMISNAQRIYVTPDIVTHADRWYITARSEYKVLP